MIEILATISTFSSRMSLKIFEVYTGLLAIILEPLGVFLWSNLCFLI